MASDTTAANQEQLMALMGAYEQVVATTGKSPNFDVIIRIYRKPSSFTYTKQILDAGQIWQIVAFKKPPTALASKPADAPDNYDPRANWTSFNPDSAVSDTNVIPKITDGQDFFDNDTHDGIDDSNVKIRNYWTFKDAKADFQAVANLFS